MEIDKKKYEEYVKQVTPTHSLAKNMAAAFLVGGIICALGQFALNFMMNNMGMDQETAAAWTLLELILLSILLTGFNIYPKIVKFGGAGALVPITGFANSVVAPAIEFHAEGEEFPLRKPLGGPAQGVFGDILFYRYSSNEPDSSVSARRIQNFI